MFSGVTRQHLKEAPDDGDLGRDHELQRNESGVAALGVDLGSGHEHGQAPSPPAARPGGGPQPMLRAAQGGINEARCDPACTTRDGRTAGARRACGGRVSLIAS